MDIVIRNGVSDKTGERIEVGIKDGFITAVSSSLPSAAQELDAGGGMISPAFIESHFHLENAYLWAGFINQSGTLDEAIEIYARVKDYLTVEDIVDRSGQVIKSAVANGTLWLRSHVDINHISKLSILKGVAAARQRYQEVITLNASRLWPIEKYGIEAGAEANLVVLDAKTAVEALRRQPDRRYVLRKGQVVAETTRQTTWHNQAALWM